ncbi:MAG TPA: class I lanthipeptide [Thermoanaerobaculia bacterium]|nr:class I lanthipeptide [Thermoanaerobaculia bacterium]
MKKKIGSLRLTRETVTKLTSAEMQGAVAGATRATLCTCNPTYPTACACTFTC